MMNSGLVAMVGTICRLALFHQANAGSRKFHSVIGGPSSDFI
jgi:hypothetical protein